jgi:hypothetical protein
MIELANDPCANFNCFHGCVKYNSATGNCECTDCSKRTIGQTGVSIDPPLKGGRGFSIGGVGDPLEPQRAISATAANSQLPFGLSPLTWLAIGIGGLWLLSNSSGGRN